MDWLRRFLDKLLKPATPPKEEAPPKETPPPAPSTPSRSALDAAGDAGAAVVQPTPPPPELPPVPPPAPPVNLDASAFLPQSREELKQEAAEQGSSLLRNPWFGRRDVIPPADDPRTKLIDRGLVSEGLLSPEQLAEIHNVGAEMDRVRPTLEAMEHRLHMAGEEAVEADRAQRAAIREQKKREAALRKQRRATAIAQRRATDILFLGRGVSAQLGKRESNRDKLASLDLPILSTPLDLAKALGMPIPRLRWLAFHTEVASRIHYVRFAVPKKSGGTRWLSAPHRDLARVQEWIFTNILDKLPVEESSHGFVKGRSTLTNAVPHVGHAIVLNMDLEDFFPSITFPRVRKVFERFGYSPAIATILALICTECPRQEVTFAGKRYFVATGPRGLPQGACTSPALANQVARRLDRRLRGLARRFELTYTRYADDLTISGNRTDRIGYLMAKIRHIAEDEGFAINDRKSRVLRRGTAQVVTGLVVNEKPNLCRAELRRIRAILHRAKTEGLQKQNRENVRDFVAWLQGKIAYIRMVRPDLGAKFAVQLQALLPQAQG